MKKRILASFLLITQLTYTSAPESILPLDLNTIIKPTQLPHGRNSIGTHYIRLQNNKLRFFDRDGNTVKITYLDGRINQIESVDFLQIPPQYTNLTVMPPYVLANQDIVLSIDLNQDEPIWEVAGFISFLIKSDNSSGPIQIIQTRHTDSSLPLLSVLAVHVGILRKGRPVKMSNS